MQLFKPQLTITTNTTTTTPPRHPGTMPCTYQLARHHIHILTPPNGGTIRLHDTAARYTFFYLSLLSTFLTSHRSGVSLCLTWKGPAMLRLVRTKFSIFSYSLKKPLSYNIRRQKSCYGLSSFVTVLCCIFTKHWLVVFDT